MSELKAHRIDNIISAYKIGKAFCMKTEEEVYLKSEADRELRRHKYRRCLAMARWCMTEYIKSKCLDFTNIEQWYWRRWHIRWRNLAEKFKEAK